MRQRQAGEPPVLGARIDRGRRRCHRGLHRERRELREPWLPRRSGRGDDQGDLGVDRDAVATTNSVLVDDHRGPGDVDERGALGSGQSEIDRKNRGSHPAGVAEHRQPLGARLQRDSRKVARPQRATQLGRGHPPSVP